MFFCNILNSFVDAVDGIVGWSVGRSRRIGDVMVVANFVVVVVGFGVVVVDVVEVVSIGFGVVVVVVVVIGGGGGLAVVVVVLVGGVGIVVDDVVVVGLVVEMVIVIKPSITSNVRAVEPKTDELRTNSGISCISLSNTLFGGGKCVVAAITGVGTLCIVSSSGAFEKCRLVGSVDVRVASATRFLST